MIVILMVGKFVALKEMSKIVNTRSFAIFQAFFVTILWSSSWPIITFGLKDEGLPPLTFAGLRYVLASVILLTIVFAYRKHRKTIRKMSPRWWIKLIVYGLIFYTITQGAQFFGLLHLENITVSLLLSFTPILVLILAIFLLKEIPTFIQALLVIIALGGAIMYFYPIINLNLTTLVIIGLLVVLFGVLANAVSSIIGRAINRSRELNPLVITAVSMFIGSIILLIIGLSTEDFPILSRRSIFYILWLSVVNTAFAFTLWNHAMQRLRAVEITIINNTMLFQITILAVILLGERPSVIQWFGLAITAIVAILLPIYSSHKKKKKDFFLLNQSYKKKLKKSRSKQIAAIYNQMFYSYY
jgi:O-acetylserine/cysteine efflux transporter